MPTAPTRLFCMFAPQDERLRTQLETHLAPLCSPGAALWSERQVLPGEHKDARITEALNRADILLFLLSPDFLASSSYREVMLPKALERQAQAILIPILARQCAWEHSGLAHLQLLLQGFRRVIRGEVRS